MTGVIAYSHETDLSKRVHKWEDRIKPQLLVEVDTLNLLYCHTPATSRGRHTQSIVLSYPSY